MRALVLAALLPLVLSACGAGLGTHAQIAAASRSLIESASLEIEHKFRADREAIQASSVDVLRRQDRLQSEYVPVLMAYERVYELHEAHVGAIWSAVQHGHRRMGWEPARAFFGAWKRLTVTLRQMGLHVPRMPAWGSL